MIRQSGEEPVIIEYLKVPPDASAYRALWRAMRMAPARAVAPQGYAP